MIDHNQMLEPFLKAATVHRITFSIDKSAMIVGKIQLLGQPISQEEIRTGPKRMKPLGKMPLSESTRPCPALSDVLALFAVNDVVSRKDHIAHEKQTFPWLYHQTYYILPQVVKKCCSWKRPVEHCHNRLTESWKLSLGIFPMYPNANEKSQ